MAAVGNGVSTTTSSTTTTATTAATGPEIEPRELLTLERKLELSPQQGLIIQLIFEEGLTNAEIAKHLAVRPSSVGTQLARIYKKLGIRKRESLVSRVWMKVIQIRDEASRDQGIEEEQEEERADEGVKGGEEESDRR